MMKNMLWTALLGAVLSIGQVKAQPAAIQKIIETGRTDNRTMHHLDILTNRFGGRLVGSDT